MNTPNLSLSQYFISLMYLIKSQDLAPPSETKIRDEDLFSTWPYANSVKGYSRLYFFGAGHIFVVHPLITHNDRTSRDILTCANTTPPSRQQLDTWRRSRYFRHRWREWRIKWHFVSEASFSWCSPWPSFSPVDYPIKDQLLSIVLNLCFNRYSCGLRRCCASTTVWLWSPSTATLKWN